MANTSATPPASPPPPGATILADEAAHFAALAADWWNPTGTSAMLHRLNPARLGYIRAQIDRHFGGDGLTRTPLAGKSALDVGCGAGLLAEPLARLGAATSGVDAAPANIAVARDHAAAQALAITYHAGELAALEPLGGQYDLVTCMEVIEHVADPGAFIRQLAARVAPGGLLILSTPNRTLASRLLLVGAAERLGMVPPGTHDWQKFLRPDELAALVSAAGLVVQDTTPLSLSPARGFMLGGSDALNYLMAASWG